MRPYRRPILIGGTLVLATALATVAVPASAATPTMRVLGTLPGYVNSYALAVNDFGTAVGFATDANGNDIAVKWTVSGAIVDLGTLPGYDQSHASDINDLGQIVGYVEDSATDEPRAVEWNAKGAITDLGSAPGKFSIASASGINNLGEVVGEDQTAPRDVGATSWRNGTINDFGSNEITDLGENGAIAVNDLGAIVGYDFVLHGGGSAVLWKPDGTFLELPDLPRDGGGRSHAQANAVNDLGEIVGISPTSTPNQYHAVRWDEQGNVTDLGLLPGGSSSSAGGVNDFGVVAGSSDDASGTTYAVTWNRDGTITTLPGTNAGANAISDTGFIVGTATDAAGNDVAIRWH